MRHSRYARSSGDGAVKRGSGHGRGKKDRWNELGASLVEYALVLSLVAVVAIGALVYLGSSVKKTLNTVAVDVTPTGGASCSTNGSALTGFCANYTWLDGKSYFPPPNGPWTAITSANDQAVFLAAATTPGAWTCSASSGSVCTTIATPANNPPVAYALSN
jgi:Flp pilus assembly pilin Flp